MTEHHVKIERLYWHQKTGAYFRNNAMADDPSVWDVTGNMHHERIAERQFKNYGKQAKLLPIPQAVKTLHSILGASNSHRWIECAASVRMEQMFPDTTSAYAEEGSTAHELAAYCLKNNCDTNEAPPFPGFNPMTQAQSDDLWDVEMRAHVQDYIDFVRLLPGDHMVEVRVDYARWAPEGFGTSDHIAIAPPLARVTDLKYGTGVKVYADKNTQGMLYALGVLNELDFIYGDSIKEFEITVYQPRLDHIDAWRISREDLLKWADEVVAPSAKLALTTDAPFNPGEKQCGFCRARGNCKARAEWNMKLALETFGETPDVSTLTPAEIATILARADEFRKWIGDIENRAFEQAKLGHLPPGFKLVEGRSNRKIVNQEDLALALELDGFTPEQMYEPREFIGLGKLEKLIGKKNPLIKEFTFRPEGAPVLVPDSDPRPARTVTTAQEAFANVVTDSDV